MTYQIALAVACVDQVSCHSLFRIWYRVVVPMRYIRLVLSHKFHNTIFVHFLGVFPRRRPNFLVDGLDKVPKRVLLWKGYVMHIASIQEGARSCNIVVFYSR